MSASDTRYRKFVKAKDATRDMLRRCVRERWTIDRFISEKHALLTGSPLWTGPAHLRLTAEQRGYLRGMCDTEWERIFHFHTQWAHDVGRELPVVGWTNLTPAEQEMVKADQSLGHHFWVTSEGQLTTERWS